KSQNLFPFLFSTGVTIGGGGWNLFASAAKISFGVLVRGDMWPFFLLAAAASPRMKAVVAIIISSIVLGTGSFYASSFYLKPLHEIFESFSVSVFDVMNFDRVFDVLRMFLGCIHEAGSSSRPPTEARQGNKNLSQLYEGLSTVTRTSLGPSGTSLFLNELVVQLPAAKLLVLAAKEQQKKFGDGANLVVSVAGQHLEGAKELITMGLSNIINLGEILEAFVEEGSETMDVSNKDQVILCMKAPVSIKLYDMEDIVKLVGLEKLTHCHLFQMQACWSREIDKLPPFSNARYMVDPSFIIMYSDSVTKGQDHVFCEDQVSEKIFKHCDNGDCEMSKNFEEVYVDPSPFQHYTCALVKICFVLRCDVQVTWYRGGISNEERRTGNVFYYFRVFLFDILMLRSDGARLIDKPEVPKPMEYGFPPEGKYAVKRSAGNDGLLIDHQLGIDVLCIERAESDDASVHNLVNYIRHISNANANVMKVHRVKILNEVYHFSIERFILFPLVLLLGMKGKNMDFTRAISERLEAKNCTLRARLEKIDHNVPGKTRDWKSKFPSQFIDVMTDRYGHLLDQYGKSSLITLMKSRLFPSHQKMLCEVAYMVVAL
nr:T-complex protein 1 subunit theta-like [Tanacetum cinerariifolium]